MDFIILVAAILLAIIAVWLWSLGKKRDDHFVLVTSLTPKPGVAVFSVPKSNTISYRSISHCYEKIKYWLHVASIIGFILSIVGIIYLVLTGQSWIAICPVVVFAVVLLVVYLISKRVYYSECLARRIEKKEAHMLQYYYSHRDYYRDDYSAYSTIRFTGEVTLPKRVYEGDSRNITVDLKLDISTPTTHGKVLCIQDTKSGKSVVLQFLHDNTLDEFLEIELLAAGLIVDGEKRQRQSLTLQTLVFRWNCYFPNSGNHTLLLTLRAVCPSGAIELGSIEHTIKVVKLDHLTKQQVWILALLAGIISGGLAIAETLRQLGVW